MAEQDPKEPVLDTPELILKDAVLRSKKLDAEAQKAISQKGDVATYRQKLAERANLIAGLFTRVKETMAKGQSFSEGELNQLEILSEFAGRAVEDGRPFTLSTILTPRPFLVGGPNLLEELVNGLYPPETEVIK